MAKRAAVFLLAVALLAAPAERAEAQVVIGYLLGGEAGAAAPKTDGLTMADYAFAVPAPDGSIPSLSGEDAAELGALASRARSSGTKVLLSLGGWAGSAGFSGAASTAANRARFAAAAVALVDRYGLDGVDVDWEYPGQSGAGNPHGPADREDFPLLLQAVRAALDAHAAASGRARRFLLTAAIAGDAAYLAHADVAAAQRSLDFVNLMAYDIYNGGDSVAGHHANLHRAPGQDADHRSVEEQVDAVLAAGVPAGKIVLGFPFYGRLWRGIAPGPDTGLYGTARTKGEFVGYDALVDGYLGRGGFTRIWDGQALAAYLWNPATRDLVSYGDPQSARLAAEFARTRGLAGVMFWELGAVSHHPELLDALLGRTAARP